MATVDTRPASDVTAPFIATPVIGFVCERCPENKPRVFRNDMLARRHSNLRHRGNPMRIVRQVFTTPVTFVDAGQPLRHHHHQQQQRMVDNAAAVSATTSSAGGGGGGAVTMISSEDELLAAIDRSPIAPLLGRMHLLAKHAIKRLVTLPVDEQLRAREQRQRDVKRDSVCPVCHDSLPARNETVVQHALRRHRKQVYTSVTRCFQCGQDFLNSSKFSANVSPVFKHLQRKHGVVVRVDEAQINSINLNTTVNPFVELLKCDFCEFSSASVDIMTYHRMNCDIVTRKPAGTN